MSSKQDPLLTYLSNVRPKSKRSGRRTNNIGLMMGKNKNVTFELRNKFPGARIINLYHSDHYGLFHRAAIQYNGSNYIWDDYKNYWHASKIGAEHLQKVLNGLNAIVLLMNTDSTKSWSDRLCDAMNNCTSQDIRNLLISQWFSTTYNLKLFENCRF